MDKGKIILLSLAHTSADVNSSAVPALLPFLAAAYGYSYTEAATVVFCHALVSALEACLSAGLTRQEALEAAAAWAKEEER